jgi:hypothetical protein
METFALAVRPFAQCAGPHAHPLGERVAAEPDPENLIGRPGCPGQLP